MNTQSVVAEFVVTRTGYTSAVHTDEAQQLLEALGPIVISRVAYVEPVVIAASGQVVWEIRRLWLGGKKVYGRFSSRRVALNVEKELVSEWLHSYS